MNRAFVPPDIPAALLQRACAALAERFGVADWTPVGQPLGARKSLVQRLASPASGRMAALKSYQLPRAARQQADALRHGAALGAGGEGFDVPVLYADYTESAALLVEWVQAPELEQVLIRAAASPRRHWEAVRASGAWLRRFHALGAPGNGRFDGALYAVQLEARLRNAPRALPVLRNDRLWRTANAELERLLQSLDGRVTPCTLTHGDFTSTNILLGNGRVTGIDAWAELRLPVADDLARMFVYLAMGDLQPLHARLVALPPGARRAQQALLEGYGTDLVPEPDTWRTLVLFETIARWLALEQRLAQRWHYAEAWKRGGLRALARGLLSGDGRANT